MSLPPTRMLSFRPPAAVLCLLVTTGCVRPLKYAPGTLPTCNSPSVATESEDVDQLCELGRRGKVSTTSGWLVVGPDAKERWVALMEYPVTGGWAQVETLATCQRTTSLESDFKRTKAGLEYSLTIVRPRWEPAATESPTVRAEWDRFVEAQTRVELGWAVTLVDAYAEMERRTLDPDETASFAQLQQDTVPAFEAFERCTCANRCPDRCASLPALLERTRWVADRGAGPGSTAP